jgi:hypothetical protein
MRQLPASAAYFSIIRAPLPVNQATNNTRKSLTKSNKSENGMRFAI